MPSNERRHEQKLSRRRRRKARLRQVMPVAAVAAGLTLAPAAEAASSSVADPGAAQGYTTAYHVSNTEAQQRLADQAAGRALPSDLQKALSDRYAGLWYDNSAGQFVVPLTPGAATAAATSAMDKAGLPGKYRFQNVASSLEELVSAQGTITQNLSSLVVQKAIETGVDPSINAVVITVSPSATNSERSQVQTEAAKASVRVKVVNASGNITPTPTTTCSFPDCNKPLRGGVQFYTNQETCTAGFLVLRNSDLHKFIMTAGHCEMTGGNWTAQDASHNGHNTGPAASHIYGASPGDGGLIDTQGSWWDIVGWSPELVSWGTLPSPGANGVQNDDLIYGAYSSYVGLYDCHSGEVSGTSCGTVSELNVKVTYTDRTTVQGLTKVGPVCELPGDSGGPWFAGSSAYGINSGGDNVGTCAGNGLYSEVIGLDNYFGVHVATNS